MLADLCLHHLGAAARSIEKELLSYEALGYTVCSPYFTDPVQGIRGVFLEAPGQPRLELLENAGPTGPLDGWLQRGVKIYHFAYHTPDIEISVQQAVERLKAKVIVPITHAEYFAKICFLMLPNMLMIEFVQLKP